MWRRGPYNPTMPVPTHHPEDGADSHLHSPRRSSNARTASTRTLSQGQPMSGVVPSGSGFIDSMPITTSFLQHNGAASSSRDVDTIARTDFMTAYDWANTSLPPGFGTQQAGEGDSTSYKPTARRSNKVSNSDTSMPDFGGSDTSLLGNHMQGPSQALTFSEPSIEDHDLVSQGLKVPTNTPTTIFDNSLSGNFGEGFSEVGNSGSRSLSISCQIDIHANTVALKSLRIRSLTKTLNFHPIWQLLSHNPSSISLCHYQCRLPPRLSIFPCRPQR